MSMDDVKSLNIQLTKQNMPSVLKLNLFTVGDRVRYLVRKGVFEKGGNTFSETVWIVTDVKHYNVRIERNGSVEFKKYWELLKVD